MVAAPRILVTIATASLLALGGCTADGPDESALAGSASAAGSATTGSGTTGSGDSPVGELSEPDPCTATRSPGPLDIGLHEVEAMAIDPWTDTGLAGNEEVEASWLLEQADAWTPNHWPEVPLWMWLESYESPDDSAVAELCDAYKRFGRVIGYSRSAAADDTTMASTEQVQVVVHLFQTDEGAKAFIKWVPTAPWVGGSAPEVAKLNAAGADAALLTGPSDGGQVQVALVRSGPFVGEVTVSGPTSFSSTTVDVAALGVKLKKRMDSVTPTGLPFDLVQVMAAPLTNADWVAIKGRGQGSPDLRGLGVELGDQRHPPLGSYDPRLVMGLSSDEQWASEMAELGYLGSSMAVGVSGENQFPTGGTQLSLFGDESEAAAALQDAVDHGLEAPGGQVFDVPGVEGAVGVRHWSEGHMFTGYTWSVYFTHGSALARAFVAGGPPDYETEVEDEADWGRNRQWAIDAALAWTQRLDRILGAGLAHAPLPSGSPQPTPADTSDSDGASTASPDPGGVPPTVVARPATIDTGDVSCALDEGGRAWCWGNTPTAVPGSHHFREITAGGSHVCGLDTAGQAWCWGRDWTGQLGNGAAGQKDAKTPTPVVGGRSYASISARSSHTCALDTAGQAWCWGQVEGNALTEPVPRQATPVGVPGDHTFTVISAGSYHACGIDKAGTAWCWGNDDHGQLGDGPGGGQFTATPVAVTGGHTFATIAAGDAHTCALDRAGNAWCWGESAQGALGEGTADLGPMKPSPVAVAGPHAFTSMDVGGMHTCAIDTAGSAWCWGNDSNFGQLGDNGEFHDKYAPVQVAGKHTFTAVAAGWGATCALDTDGRAWCWGDDQGGQLGQGKGGAPECDPEHSNLPCSDTPLAVTGKLTFQTS